MNKKRSFEDEIEDLSKQMQFFSKFNFSSEHNFVTSRSDQENFIYQMMEQTLNNELDIVQIISNCNLFRVFMNTFMTET